MLAVLLTASVAALAANTTTVMYNTTAAGCRLVNAGAWVTPACWTGGVVPTASSVVHFAPSTVKINVSLQDALGAYKLDAMIAGGMLIGAQQEMVMNGGKFFFHGDVLVEGALTVHAQWNDSVLTTQMPNRNLIPPDVKARAAGYRDCSYVDWGFDSRVCGLGKLVVAKSGTVTVGGGYGFYSNMFMEVEVHGKYLLSAYSFQWKPVVNYGHMVMGTAGSGIWSVLPAYLHASVFNKGILVVPEFAVVNWDGYSPRADYPWETFTQYSIVNEAGGLMNLSGLLSGSNTSPVMHEYNGTLANWGELHLKGPSQHFTYDFKFLNYNHTTVYGTLGTIEGGNGVLELAPGTVVTGTVSSVGGKVVLRDDPFTCAGKKHGMTRFEPGASLAVVDAEVVLDGGELFTESFVAKNSRLTLVNEGKLNLHSASGDGYCSESFIQYCGCDTCGEPSCRSCVCCSEGACPMQKSGAEFGTLQEPMGVMAKTWKNSLNTDAAARVNFTKSLRAMMKRPRPAKGAPYRFEGLEVRGDATGSIVASATLLVTGVDRHALSVSNATVFAIMERGSPVFLGRGSVHIGSDATFVLGTDAALDGGRLSVGNGGRVVVDAHSRLTVGNHTVSVEKGGSFVADGKVRFGAAARVHVCGTRVAEGAAPSFLGC